MLLHKTIQEFHQPPIACQQLHHVCNLLQKLVTGNTDLRHMPDFAYSTAQQTSRTYYLGYSTQRALTKGLTPLQKLVTHYEDLSHMPNFAYSTVLADFRERTGDTADKQGRASGFAPASGPSSSRHEEEDQGEASLEERLSHAVMMYPSVVVRLMDK